MEVLATASGRHRHPGPAAANEESAMRRTLLAVAVLMLFAGQASAYTIFLKDGSRLQAREKYRVTGDKAIIVLPSGSMTELPLARIDVERTERGNATDYGNATVVEGPTASARPATPQAPSLSDVASSRRLAPPPERASPPPSSAVTDAAARTAAGSRTAHGGSVDFLRMSRTPLTRVDVGTLLGQLLRARGLESAAFYEGTRPRRVLVEITTNSEGAVFQAIAATALALLDLEAQRPGAVEAIELFMATDRRARAGQFQMTPARARELASKQLDITSFFLRYVEF
jgi:hypothetical protein